MHEDYHPSAKGQKEIFPVGVRPSSWIKFRDLFLESTGNQEPISNELRIQQLNVQTGNFVKSFGKEGSGDGEFVSPVGVCITGDGRFIVVTEFANSRIQVFTMDGEPVFKFGDNGPERLDHPTSCVCYKEKFFIPDKKNNCVKVFDEIGQFLYKFGTR